MNLSFETGAAFLRGKAGLSYLTSVVLPVDFSKRQYSDFLFALVGIVETKKAVVAVERTDCRVFTAAEEATTGRKAEAKS